MTYEGSERSKRQNNGTKYQLGSKKNRKKFLIETSDLSVSNSSLGLWMDGFNT